MRAVRRETAREARHRRRRPAGAMDRRTTRQTLRLEIRARGRRRAIQDSRPGRTERRAGRTDRQAPRGRRSRVEARRRRQRGRRGRRGRFGGGGGEGVGGGSGGGGVDGGDDGLDVASRVPAIAPVPVSAAREEAAAAASGWPEKCAWERGSRIGIVARPPRVARLRRRARRARVCSPG